jgi:hypothetical protein
MTRTEYIASMTHATASPNIPHPPMVVQLANVERVRAKLAALKAKMVFQR